jgi:uncharacterized protein YfaS (alpha-2-macroglobulin family)
VIVQPNLPTFITLGDTIKLPVVVKSSQDKTANLQVLQ